MANCFLCGGTVTEAMSLSFLFSWRPAEPPTVCTKCRARLVSLKSSTRTHCPTCYVSTEEGKQCLACQTWAEAYPECAFLHQALYAHIGLAEEWLERYTIIGDTRLSRIFAKEIRSCLRPLIQEGYTIVPLPSHECKLADGALDDVARLLVDAKVPYASLLVCQKSSEQRSNNRTHVKHGAKRSIRCTECDTKFVCMDTHKGNVHTKQVVLVDLSYGTGKTMWSAASLLYKNGVEHVKTFSVLR